MAKPTEHPRQNTYLLSSPLYNESRYIENLPLYNRLPTPTRHVAKGCHLSWNIARSLQPVITANTSYRTHQETHSSTTDSMPMRMNMHLTIP